VSIERLHGRDPCEVQPWAAMLCRAQQRVGNGVPRIFLAFDFWQAEDMSADIVKRF
jgi:hypothetical protein